MDRSMKNQKVFFGGLIILKHRDLIFNQEAFLVEKEHSTVFICLK